MSIVTHKVRTRLVLSVPKFGIVGDDKYVELKPKVIAAKFTRNNHLTADELTVTVGWKEAGLDPRTVRNARCAFALWDSALEDFDAEKHVRFKGVAVKLGRRMSDNGWVVDITFHDYTTLFIHMKPFKTAGMPEWSDTLQQIWERICDNTGWESSDHKILSSVAFLKNELEIRVPEFESKPLGEIVNERFRLAAKPTPKTGASAWDVWQWCCGALGLISYIDVDRCIVTNATEHFNAETAPLAIYGQNIFELEENLDSDIDLKGILLKSFDPLVGRVLEARYPPPGDERIKTPRGAVGPKSAGGAVVTANEVSQEYEEFFRFDIQDQEALDRAAFQAYEERCRQSLEGSFKTAETELFDRDEVVVDVFSLRAGDKVRIELSVGLIDSVRKIGGDTTWGTPDSARVRYLVDTLGYDEGVAQIIVMNLNVEELQSAVFNITSITYDLEPESFMVEVKFHNLILIDT